MSCWWRRAADGLVGAVVGGGGQVVQREVVHRLGGPQVDRRERHLVADEAAPAHLRHLHERSRHGQRILIGNEGVLKHDAVGGGGPHPDGVPLGSLAHAGCVAGDQEHRQRLGRLPACELGRDQVVVGHPGGAAERLDPVDQPPAAGAGSLGGDGYCCVLGPHRLAGEVGHPATVLAHPPQHPLAERAGRGHLVGCEQPCLDRSQREQAPRRAAALEVVGQRGGRAGGGHGVGGRGQVSQAAAQAPVGDRHGDASRRRRRWCGHVRGGTRRCGRPPRPGRPARAAPGRPAGPARAQPSSCPPPAVRRWPAQGRARSTAFSRPPPGGRP